MSTAVRRLDTSTMFTDDVLPHVLVITGPSALKYSSMTAALNAKGGNRVGSYNTFYSQVSHFREAVVDAPSLPVRFRSKTSGSFT